MTMHTSPYDPFAPGPSPVGTRTMEAHDPARNRLFPCDLWYPARSGAHPLLIYSHSSGGHRRSSTFLCTHLASHGYVVAAMDHSEVIAGELHRRDGETDAERVGRIEAVIGSRVPDVRFLLAYLLDGGVADIALDATRVGLVGHSFGGWTVLATPEVEPRIRAVVAMVPGGSANPRPGILPVTLSFNWGRDVPTLYLAAEDDVMIPLDRVAELFDRTRGSKRMFILRRADHQHFVDDVEGEHEAIRAMSFPGEAAWIPAAMRPISELSSGDQAHLFVRGLTLAHFDATLRQVDAAEQLLAGEVETELAERGVEVIAYS